MRLKKPLTFAVWAAVSCMGAALASGCVENRSSIYIHQIMATPTCEITYGPDEPSQSIGRLDLAFKDSYTASILIGNQLRPLGDSNTLRTETSRFVIKGVEIHVLSQDQGTELKAFTAVASGTISPDASNEPGFGGFATTIIPSGLPLEPDKQYVVSLRVFGETLAGTPLETGEFFYPVDTCYGCFAAGVTKDAAGNITGCVGGDTETCFPGQGPTDCVQCINAGCAE